MRACAIAVGLSLGLAACTRDAHFQCAQSDQCGADGRCELDGSCSFPDPTCDSGRRYGDYGDPAVSGTCVSASMTTTGVDDDDGASTWLTGSTSAGGTLALEDGTSLGATTGGPTGPGPTGSGPTGSDGGTLGSSDATETGSGETGEPISAFFDDFERPDGDVIGNGWWEKTPTAFELVGGEVLRSNSADSYYDNLVLRPDTEIQRDVEITMIVRPIIADPPGSPQIHARVQEDDFATPGSVTGYILFIEDAHVLAITRQEASDFATYFTEPVVPMLTTDGTYRLRFVISGEDPVVLDGYLEELARDGRWLPHTEIHIVDGDPTRIATPGRIGFSGHLELEHCTYDDFAWTALP